MTTLDALTHPAAPPVPPTVSGATITVNGNPVDLTPDVGHLAAVLARFAPSCVAGGPAAGHTAAGDTAAPLGVAAAVNDRVVPRGAWATTVLRAGDRVEIVTAVQGG